jgi:protein-disulfide isomerase
MNKGVVTGAIGGAVAVGMLALGIAAGRMSGGEPTVIAAPEPAAVDRPAIEAIVRDYLMANPELFETMQVALEAKRDAEQKEASKTVISEAGDAIFKDPFDHAIGNPNGNVTIVEFFDYNCGYCKRALSDMQTMVEKDPQLRFVLKEFPILGPESHKASIVSAAFGKLYPERYAEFHQRLLSAQGRAGEAPAIKIALDLGADEAALREAMKDPTINERFSATYDLATKLGVTGTPSYVVGDEVVFGALGSEVLTEKIANVRACAKATC